MTAGIAEIRVQGAGRANILDADALEALARSLRRAERAGARAAVIRGPEGAFAAGADLGVLSRLSGVDAHRFGLHGARVLRLMARTPLWLAAAVDGHCIGGGLDVALACDVVVASSRSRFRHPGAWLGFPTAYGGNRRLPARTGPGLALGILARGEALSAAEALRTGLVEEITAPGDLLAAARARMHRWVDAAAPGQARSLQRLFRMHRHDGGGWRLERTALECSGTSC
ncbi:MAG: enoyl-CoA hydratase/isomerase family protein [Acidobacteriota bacterium]